MIGPNGAGKSTLFNLITGHLQPTAGRVVVDGRDITGVAPHKICGMGMGRSFQRTNIFPKLTVLENVQAAFLVHRGQGAEFLVALGAALSRRLRGAARLDRARRPGEHHGGHAVLRQPEAARARHRAGERPARSCCSTSRPPACRRARRTRSIALLERIAHERGLTLLFTEHDMAVVFSIAQKIAVLHQGRIIAHGDPATVRADAEVRRVYLGGPRDERPAGARRTSMRPTG